MADEQTPPTMFSICERIVRDALFCHDDDAAMYLDWDLVGDAYKVLVDLASKGADVG